MVNKKSKLESDIQAKKIKQLEKEGYYVIKLIKTNKNAIPDIVAIPRDVPVRFIEMKRPGKDSSPLQKYRQNELRSFGFIVEQNKGE